MSESTMEVLAGGTFVFKVGSAQTSFSLHRKLVTQRSRPLSKLILGSMREAKEGSALLDDVEEKTFARFAEYIYGGGYNVPSPLILPTLSPKADSSNESVEDVIEEAMIEPAEEPAAEPSDWSYPSKKKKKSLSRLEEFALPTPTLVPFPQLIAQQVLEVPQSPLDYTKILHCHAQLYVFADRYDVVGLKDLVLCRMHSVLEVMSSFSRVGNIVPTIEYIYQNTPYMTSSDEPMRDLLTLFVAWKFRTLMREEAFREYFAKGGDFVIDVCRKVGIRLDT